MKTERSKYVVSPEISVREAIQAIEANGKKAVFVLDDDSILLGLFSDGDMRKYILKGGDLSAPVKNAMNQHPIVYRDRDIMLQEMKYERRVVFPLVDEQNHLVDAVFWNDFEKKTVSRSLSEIPLVIMAGGKGTRLKPYTNILPKALVPIGDVTITERIINQFLNYGCKNVSIILNHKKNMIKAYFNEVEKVYDMHYVEEEEPLGTGGGIGLLRDSMEGSFFVSNCDILVDTDYGYLYNYHKEKGNKITVVCAMKNVIMPYGIMVLDENECIKDIAEKPTQSFLTNTGFYLLEPDVFSYIEENEKIDITGVILRMSRAGEKVGVYPVSEKCWMDMGQIGEMERMLKELGEL